VGAEDVRIEGNEEGVLAKEAPGATANITAFETSLDRFRHSNGNQMAETTTLTYKVSRKRSLADTDEEKKPPSPSLAKKRRESSHYVPPSEYAHVPKLLDILEPNLIYIFAGTNPGTRTVTAGHAYAHLSKLFWKLLHSSGCTDVRLLPENDVDLPRWYAIGNRNIVGRPSKDAAELSKTEMSDGTPILEEKMRKYRPEAVWRWGYKREIGKSRVEVGTER